MAVAEVIAAPLLAASPALSDESRVSFERQIQPILDENCVICHQIGSAPQGLVLEQGSSFAALVARTSREAAQILLVTPGRPEESYLVAKLEGRQLAAGGQGDQMPLGGRLDAQSILLIRRWIAEGATAK